MYSSCGIIPIVNDNTTIIVISSLENTEGAIKNGKSRETGNTWSTIHKQTQINVNKTWTILQATGGKDEPNIVLELHEMFWSLNDNIKKTNYCLKPYVHSTESINMYSN